MIYLDVGDGDFGPYVRVRSNASECSVMGYYAANQTRVNICICLQKPQMFGKCPDCDITNSKLVEAFEMLYNHYVQEKHLRGRS